MIEYTYRWRGAVAATIVLAVAGLATKNGALLIAAAVPLVSVAYGSLTTVDVPSELTAKRTVEPAIAPPGRPVTVTVTVTNGSGRTLSDVRLIDGVPAKLAVVDGSPRVGTTLAPGETCTVEYTLIARRGTHEFDAPRLRVRSPSAGAVATTPVDVDGETVLTCRLDAEAPPLDDRGDATFGHLAGDRPGEGVAFHSTRTYRTGDPSDRIDWRHYAKRGTLATVNYDRPVETTVVLVVDARQPNRVVAGPGRPTAVELAAYAATRALTDLLRSGHDVGVALVGLDAPDARGVRWLPPKSGPVQRAKALELFRDAVDECTNESDEASAGGGDTTDDPRDVSADALITTVANHVPDGSQLALFSPVLDDWATTAVERWGATGHARVVLSPDVLSTNTVSGQYEQVRRRTRLARCQATGARTIDWRRGTPLALVVEHAFSVAARLPARTVGATTGGGG